DGRRVVAVQSSQAYIHNVVIFDYDSQQVLKQFPNPDNAFYAMPRWSADGKGG
ncbi:MAG: hypothetical protein HC859_13600, partial [Bacteroidia bacterium]|nr:hypothetical protein [Bacteroidia bacterium]